MPETPEDDLSYMQTADNAPEPEDDAAAPAPEPEEEPAEAGAETEGEGESTEGEEEPREEPVTGRQPAAASESEQPRRRPEARVQKLANERNAEREARIRLETELKVLKEIRSTTPADNGESARLRKEKLDLMEPNERSIFLQNERIEQLNHQMLITQLRSQDSADKAAFDSKAVVDPRYARNKEDTEKELTRLRSIGINATREEALAVVLGRKLLAEKPRKDARAAAAQRVASTTGKPTNARSAPSTPVGKGDSLADLESRLRGKSFDQMFNS